MLPDGYSRLIAPSNSFPVSPTNGSSRVFVNLSCIFACVFTAPCAVFGTISWVPVSNHSSLDKDIPFCIKRAAISCAFAISAASASGVRSEVVINEID